MGRTAILAISRGGGALARRLSSGMAGETDLYLERRQANGADDAIIFDLPARPVVRQVFAECQRLVLFMPVGAAIRLLAPCLRDKHHDPAVVCVDDAGRFAVSLLSGHLGGADALAEEVAKVLEATPVITSASYVTGVPAVDLLGQNLGWRLEADNLSVTRASAAVVNGDPVGIYQDAGESDWWLPGSQLPGNLRVYPSLSALAASSCVAALVITDRRCPPERPDLEYPQLLRDKVTIVYRPRSLVAGMGCRRGVPLEELESLLTDTFREHNLSLDSLRYVATADLKRDEAGLIALAEQHGVPVHCYSGDALNGVFETTAPAADSAGLAQRRAAVTPSPVAHNLIGVWGVSEPAALLSANSRELLVTRRKTQRATIAVARMSFAGHLAEDFGGALDGEG